MLKKVIIIAGMHRSGTSVITRAVNLLGASAPGTLMPPTPDNPDGYWESSKIEILNDRLIASAGLSWKSYSPISETWFSSTDREADYQEAMEILEYEYGDAETGVLKCPRICVLIPFWEAVFIRLNIPVFVVIVVRNPTEVARSLAFRATRDAFREAAIENPDHSTLLWLKYTTDAVFFTKHLPRVIIDYNRFKSDWQQSVQPLLHNDFTDLNLRLTSDAKHSMDEILIKNSGEAVTGNWEYKETVSAPFLLDLAKEVFTCISIHNGSDGRLIEAVKNNLECVCGIFDNLTGRGAHEKNYARIIGQSLAVRTYCDRLVGETQLSDTSVLILSGEPHSVSHLFRVTHLKAALEMAGCSVHIEDARQPQNENQIKKAGIIVLFRVAWTKELDVVFKVCNYYSIPLVYDIDEYVFDVPLIRSGKWPLFYAMNTEMKRDWLKLVRGYRASIQRCDIAVLSTTPLTNAAAGYISKTLMIPNTLSQSLLDNSITVSGGIKRAEKDKTIRVGYASGTNTHFRDFGTIIPAITHILNKYPLVNLVILGELDPDFYPDLRPFKSQIEYRPTVDMKEMPAELYRFDINIAPFETDNLFCEAKSELKYALAAAVATPTIASPTQPMVVAISHGINGMLANTTEEWINALQLLITDMQIRERMGKTAQKHVKICFGPDAGAFYTAKSYSAIRDINQIKANRDKFDTPHNIVDQVDYFEDCLDELLVVLQNDGKKNDAIYTESAENQDEDAFQNPQVKRMMIRLREIEAVFHDQSEQKKEIEAVVQNLSEQKRILESQIYDLSARREMLETEKGILITRIWNLESSRSWKLTAPIRNLVDWSKSVRSRFKNKLLIVSAPHIKRPIPKDHALKGPKHELYELLRAVLIKLPVSRVARNRLRVFFYHLFPIFERYSGAIRQLQTDIAPTPISFPEPLQEEINYIPHEILPPLRNIPAKVIAFYLPQFHQIPENDRWWGSGFTEWTNVSSAMPQFEGHFQPRIPGELGYYNLLDPQVQAKQIQLAKNYGIGGFCFHFYWFNGKTLLEQPIINYLNNSSLDLPFCLSWANENWTRRWDGLDHEILIAQQYSPEDDIAFISYVSQYLLNERYIRVDGRPLIIIYRPGILPDTKKTVQGWREWCIDNGIGEIFVAGTLSFDNEEPHKFGLDAMIEFPPNNMGAMEILHSLEKNVNFAGNLLEWRHFWQLSRKYHNPDYLLFRGVNPGWDNTARRKKNATVFLNNSPSLYREWLENAIRDTLSRFGNRDRRLVFVNAWNEWAEGAYLEPDEKYGYAWLRATYDALKNTQNLAQKTENKVIIVSHDAHPHGAQFLALELTRMLVRDLGIGVQVILLGDGELKGRFEAVTDVHCTDPQNPAESIRHILHDLITHGYTRAIVNTTVSGWVLPAMKQQGMECVSLVHELPQLIREHGIENCVRDISDSADRIVFPSEVVKTGFLEFCSIDENKVRIRPQGLIRMNKWRYHREEARARILSSLNLSPDVNLVLNVAYADKRKGVDLFVEIAREVVSRNKNTVFVWVGHIDFRIENEIKASATKYGLENVVRFIPFTHEITLWFSAADIFALTSREDPFPNVVIDSFNTGVPVIAFENSGGAGMLIQKTGGITVPGNDTIAFAEAILNLTKNSSLRAALGSAAQEYSDIHWSFRQYSFFVCEEAGLKLPKISVVIPNFNYGHYLKGRLESIISQTKAIFEIILLDDASTDNSLEVLYDWMEHQNVEIRIINSEKNSGSVFTQWKKGIEAASGEYVWIAEADDLCEPDFLETVLTPMLADQSVVLSYCESKQTDSSGALLALDYDYYLRNVSDTLWAKNRVSDGSSEVAEALAVLNSIPNVSAVLFRRDKLLEVATQHSEEIGAFKMAADYALYVRLLGKGKVAYSRKSSNIHRRHQDSVTATNQGQALFDEIVSIQDWVTERYPVSRSTRKKIDDYRNQLRNTMLGPRLVNP
jgi:glycosyltransferase involved in cell wall biosynthesis/GT2 family glycosyltransferase